MVEASEDSLDPSFTGESGGIPRYMASPDINTEDFQGAVDFLMNEPATTSRNGALRDNPTVENYLHEAGLAADPPSGTVYTDSQGHNDSR